VEVAIFKALQMLYWLCFAMGLASKVAVVSDDAAQLEQSRGLQRLLETVTGSNQTARVFISN
jgi:hypothetical protein